MSKRRSLFQVIALVPVDYKSYLVQAKNEAEAVGIVRKINPGAVIKHVIPYRIGR